MEYPNYTGRGNHNIHQLEALCEQFQEYIHQLQISKEIVSSKNPSNEIDEMDEEEGMYDDLMMDILRHD